MQHRCSCGEVLDIPAHLAGQEVECSSCGKVFRAGGRPGGGIPRRPLGRRPLSGGLAPGRGLGNPGSGLAGRRSLGGSGLGARGTISSRGTPGARGGLYGGRGLRPHRGVMILVFGILGFALCGLFGIAAWVMGNADLKEMRAGRMDPSGEGLTSGGRICGMIATFLVIVQAVILLIVFGVFASDVHRMQRDFERQTYRGYPY